MHHLTVRNVRDDLASALREEQQRRGSTLNQTVLDLLRRALGLTPSAPYDNGLSALAGTWSAEDLAEFEEATADFDRVDEDDWK